MTASWFGIGNGQDKLGTEYGIEWELRNRVKGAPTDQRKVRQLMKKIVTMVWKTNMLRSESMMILKIHWSPLEDARGPAHYFEN